MKTAIPLIEFVPVYKYENSSQKNSENNSDWVKNKKELGDKGELLVKSYLEDECNAIVEKQPDNAGFDFKVRFADVVSYVEVKTTNNREKSFYMSSNEIKISKQKGSSYCVYFVIINGNEAEIHIIVNPFDVLGLNEIYENEYSNGITMLRTESVKIELLDLNKIILLKKFLI